MNTAPKVIPKIGDKATLHVGSDRYAYDIVHVTPAYRRITLRACVSRRTDSNGMSESQAWTSESNLNGKIRIATLSMNGRYYWDGSAISIGEHNPYLDPSF